VEQKSLGNVVLECTVFSIQTTIIFAIKYLYGVPYLLGPAECTNLCSELSSLQWKNIGPESCGAINPDD
jgi:hypothetical protein